VRLKDITTKVGSGATPKGGQSVYLADRERFALIRSQNVFDRYFSSDGLAYISDQHAAELAGAEVQPGDLLLNITGDGVTFARASLAPQWVLPACVNQHVSIIRPDPERCCPGYLLSYLTHPTIKDYIESFNAGGSRRAITKGHIESFEVPLAPLPEQRRIADILGMLDDKIELNRRMNQALEATARAVFKSWFVDFDPVRAKAEGRQPVEMDADTAALFPATLMASPLGKIPTGWKAGCLGGVAENPRHGADPGAVQPGTAYIGLEHMPRKSIALAEWGTAEVVASNKFRFSRGDILFGKLRPYFHKVGVAVLDGVCSTDILVIRPRSAEWYGLVLFHASSEELVGHADSTSTGTKMPRTNWSDLAKYPIAVPPLEVARTFSEKVRSFIEGIRSNILQSRTLGAIRDALLLKLLSGELRVREAQDAAASY
jgi:type I restriction enzyme S subunit